MKEYMYRITKRFNKSEGIVLAELIKTKKTPTHGGGSDVNVTKHPRITVADLAITVASLATTVTDLAKEMREGFKELKSDVQVINARLDNLVKVNNLKE
jgi:hypothetical protein